MSEALEKALADVRRFPEARQRDAADCIMRTLLMDARTFAKLDRWRQEDAERQPIDFPDDLFDDLPERMKVREVPRNPFADNPALTDELATAIRQVREASADRQRYVAYLLSEMVEGDSWDVILSPQLRADLKAAMQEDHTKYLSIEERESASG
jgi:hypothetical protein